MPMNTSERPEVLRDTADVQEHRANPSVRAVPQEHGSGRQTPPRNPAEPYVPDEGAFEGFVGGAGI
jgi:hypothetical protein